MTEQASVVPDTGKEGKKRKKGGIWTVIMCLALAVFVVAAAYLGVIFYSYWNDANRYQEISDNVVVETPTGDLADMTADWEALRAINPEIIGWIYIPDTPINYPVCWSGDDDKYLKTNFDGANGVWTGAGTIFLEGENKPDLTDPNYVLYGHHMNDGSMFACLSDFADAGVFEEHRTVYFLTPARNHKFKSFALVRTNGSDMLVTVKFPTSADMIKYVKDKEDRSMVTPVEGFPDPLDVKQLLTLATCDYNQDDGRAVLFCSLEEVASPRNAASTVVGTTEGYVTGESVE